MPIVLNTDQPLISIDIYYVEEKKPQGHSIYHFIRSQDEMDYWLSKGYEVDSEEESKRIEKLSTAWKRLTWKEYNSITAQCLRFTGTDKDRRAEIDPLKFRELKLKNCLKRWNVTDSEGNPVEVSPTTLDALVPEVANELLYSFEKVTEPEEHDVKK